MMFAVRKHCVLFWTDPDQWIRAHKLTMFTIRPATFRHWPACKRPD